MLAKKICANDPTAYLQFRNNGNTDYELKEKIQGLFDDAKKKWEGIFTDESKILLSPSHLAVCVASLQDIKGSGSTPCTRAAAVTYLWKLAGSPKMSVNSSFTDVPASADFAQAVAWAVEQGVTNGVSASEFAPDSTCTRGQIVTFLYRNLLD